MADQQKASRITGYPLLADADSLIADGKLEQAAQQTMVHLRQHPNEPRGLLQLGTIAVQLGALGQAEHFVRKALANGANPLDTKRMLASILNQQERLAEARLMFEELLQLEDDARQWAILTIVLDKIGRNLEAMEIHERLVRDNADRPHYWIGYGHSLRAAGRLEEAVQAYRSAIKADFECGDAWWGLASIKKRVFTDDDITAIHKTIAIAIDIRNSAPAHFALARALHDRGEFAEAFKHYAIGNQQRAESIGYDSSELTAEVEEVERSVDAAFLAKLDRPSVHEAVPIFIVSLPRSGSTLLEQMLGSHPDIEPAGELPYIPAILRSIMEMATRQRKITVPQLIASLSDQQADVMGADYLKRAQLHRKTDRPYFIDKLPHNWSNILFIKRILPQARFIDIRRPAMDCCFSNFSQSFSSAHASSFALDDIGQCYVDYVRFMDHLDRLAADMVHHVDYQHLVADAESELKNVMDYLQLPWNRSVLEFHKLDRVVRTPSSEQVRRPLNRDGIDTWKPYEQWLGPLRTRLGALAES
jgi:tetratricopeptide (TPR) repeat protein